MLLSLTVIVRDDAALLADLLERHRPLYDEAVVVDTGSRDDTRACAVAHGARVVDFPWCDDFAAARNAGLAAARGRWLLCLDVDERIAARDLPRLRTQVRRAARDRCFLFAFRSYADQARHAEWQPVTGEYPDEERDQPGWIGCINVRLFPNRPDLRYAGRVHESVEPTARALGLPCEALDVPIHHYGLRRPAPVMAAKDDLYGRLVRAKFAAEPLDSGAGLEMACRLAEEGQAEAALPLLEELSGREPADAHILRARLYLGHARRRQGRLDEAARLLTRLADDCPAWAQPWVELARTLAAAGRWADLGAVLERARRWHPGQPQLAQQEVVLLTVTGQVPAARQLAEELARRHPGWDEARQLAARLARSPLAGLTPAGR
ncbi:MAG: glycosyltransferase [Candidatus Krumholzibacteriia bacterium]